MAATNGGLQLTPRLAEVATYVRPGKCMVDVGTDHAYLPIWLIQSGRCPRAIATDLREGPLAHASANAYKYRVQTKLSLRICNGLAGVSPGEVADIVIAGMGGELISRILEAAPWVRNAGYNLVLQAMSSAEELRSYLRQNGFTVRRETAVRDGGHVYTVMNAVYSGMPEAKVPGGDYFGKLEVKASAEAREYIERQLRHLTNCLRGKQIRGDAEGVKELESEIQGLRAKLAEAGENAK